MQKFRTIKEANQWCVENGHYREAPYMNKQRIRSMIKNAEINISAAELIIKSIDKKNGGILRVLRTKLKNIILEVNMVVKIEKFNNLDSLLIDMVVGYTTRYLLQEIKDHIESELERFSTEHLDELVEALDRDDYDDDPLIDSYERFYFRELAPEIRSKMEQSGYRDEDIEGIISWGDGLFYKSVLPSVRDKKRKRDMKLHTP